MAQTVRTAWNANRWLATGLLASTGLFLLLMFVNWRNERRGIAAQRATGLDAILKVIPVDYARAAPVASPQGVFGGALGEVRPVAVDRQVVRSGTLEIIATDPFKEAEQLRNLAMHLSGFIVSSKITGVDQRMRSAQVTMRIPAEYFDQAREQVRAIAKAVEQDTVEARDVTREYVDQEATLRNCLAEEAQYLTILKRATAVKDVLEVSSKLAEVRGRIGRLEADLRLLHHEVEMSLLTINITAMAEAQVFGIRWRPLYKAKLSVRSALTALADYVDSIVELFLNLPVVVMWGFTIVALLKVGWIVLRRVVLLFFPGLTTWLHRRVQSQAG
jgi:hypothetical protein